jgi:hypothetical protein
LCSRLQRSVAYLNQLQDEQSGQLPNYGENDGALLLPLSNSLDRDFRPLTSAASAILEMPAMAPAGPWDEAALWLGGRLPGTMAGADRDAAHAAPRTDVRLDLGGCHTLRGRHSHVVIRCTSRYRHRPGHADGLHLDLWWRGLNMTLDPGTFSYNAAPPWDHPLAGAQYHNTLTIDGQEPMTRGGRFLWLDWHRGWTHRHDRSPASSLGRWEGSHDGYRRLGATIHRAVLQVGQEHFLVVDRLTARRRRRMRLHWLLPALPHRWHQRSQGLSLDTAHGEFGLQLASLPGGAMTTLVIADPHSPRGWTAPRYGQRAPAISLAMEAEGEEVTFATLLGPGPRQLRLSRHLVTARCDATPLQARLYDRPCPALVCGASFDNDRIQDLPASEPPAGVRRAA